MVRARAAAAENADATAQRARRDRWPDPTLAVTYGRERGGAERIGGLSISVPLGVRRRAADAARAAAAAEAATADFAATLAEAQRQWVQIDAQWQIAKQSWRSLAEAEQQNRRAADLSRRGFELGETSLADSLIVRRAALQASLAERAAALEAWRAQAIRASVLATLVDPDAAEPSTAP
jgi:outer membrane protein TolC